MRGRWLLLAALLPVAACSKQESVVTAPPIAPAPIVELVGTEVSPGFARITWQVTYGTGKTFHIDRRLNDKPWKHVFVQTTNVEGGLILDDASVQPGQTYSYRVLPEGAAPDAFQGAVTIVVPQ